MSAKREFVPLADRALDAIAHAIYDGGGSLVAAVFPPGEQDIARRLVACWNVMRGIDTPDIERGRVEVHRVNVSVGINNGKISFGKS